ncbi:MAG TPA: zinc-binding dehydrogenase [Methylosinus sp.]|jgi:NADPH2:quinone reductase|uniref:zinc-binding dehydrogenase n=1 Tax=Methylosinus sp. TaxID=427 RepID=UPI002F9321C0
MGRLVIYGSLNILDFDLGVPDLLGLIFHNQTITGFALASLLTPRGLQRNLTQLFAMAARGDIVVTIGGVYPLDQAAAAHRALESRRTRGKIVLIP